MPGIGGLTDGYENAHVERRGRRCRRHFLEFFPDGFRDETYVETERAFKWDAHRAWRRASGGGNFAALIDGRRA